jgi:hypothetical protein
LPYVLQLHNCVIFASDISEACDQSVFEGLPVVAFAERFAFSLTNVLFLPEISIPTFEEGKDVVRFLGWSVVEAVLDCKTDFCIAK